MKKNPAFLLIFLCVIGIRGGAQSIYDAIDDGSLERVKALILANKSLVHLTDGRLNTPLHMAVSEGEKEIAVFLIQSGADINAQDDLGRTPLHRATYFRPNLDMIDLLIQYEANPNVLNNDGNPAISNAIDGIKIDAVKKIVEGGYRINLKLTQQSTILHHAAEHGSVELIGYLIERGADVNAGNVYDVTPLHLTAVYGHKEASALLIESGANINAKSRWCGTPLQQAAAAGYKELAVFLKRKGAADILRNYPVLKGEYLGMKAPGTEPWLFAPEVLQNLFRWAKPPLFSPDGLEMNRLYLTINERGLNLPRPAFPNAY